MNTYDYNENFQAEDTWSGMNTAQAKKAPNIFKQSFGKKNIKAPNKKIITPTAIFAISYKPIFNLLFLFKIFFTCYIYIKFLILKEILFLSLRRFQYQQNTYTCPPDISRKLHTQ